MPVKGIERVRRNLKVKVAQIAEGTTEGAVYEILATGAAQAQVMTPQDTGNLVNSQYAPQIDVKQGRVSGQVGYSAGYAEYVHDAPGKLKGLPRDPNNPGRGDFWDPNAEPEFLTKGFEEIKPAIPAILKRRYGV
ncbi:hypothetical protein CAL20_09850 [Bordetella genomosp. 4]|uniref:HK97 gp10 family phage protein n=1 Tax=Bordetella genomosp. 4 TaxID=463044 RepID=A0A261U6V8_9BORD|nr:hypothetical protein CAL20_09850 [Bordetella genomosp. 4]